MPKTCPVCGAKTVQYEGEVAIRCENVSCSAQLKQRILHFASRNAMDIEGLGEAVVEQLVDKKLIKDYGDLYYLKLNQIKRLERFAEKSAQNLINAIEKSKDNELSRLIFALGIRHVGVHAAWILSETYGSIENIAKENIESLQTNREIGPVMAESIHAFFKNNNNLKVLEKFKKAGLKMAQKITKVKGIFSGKAVVFTGALASMTRNEAEGLVRKQGGRTSSSISKDTDLVVVGTQPGSKYEKAKKLGIKIISEDKFKNWLKTLLIIILIANISGCAELRRKFIRKKEPKKEEPSFYRVEEYKVKPPHERYQEHYVLWHNWHLELERTEPANYLRDIASISEALRHLTAMRDLLQEEKAKELGIEITQMEAILANLKEEKKDITKDVRSRRLVEKIRRVVVNNFSYKRVKNYIKSD